MYIETSLLRVINYYSQEAHMDEHCVDNATEVGSNPTLTTTVWDLI